MTNPTPTKPTLSLEEIVEKNASLFQIQINKITSSGVTQDFIDKVVSKMLVTPASTRLDLVCCYPGGLLEHSLRTLFYMAKLRKVYDLDSQVTPEEVIKTSLLHDLGKLGSLDEEVSYYHDIKAGDWRINRFQQYYEINQDLFTYPVSQLSLQMLVENKINISKNEWYAISSIRDKAVPVDDSTPKHEPVLATILQQAVKMACVTGKNKKDLSVVF
jgi:hypothetical protein